MTRHLENLVSQLRALNRRIANCRAVSRQEDLKVLKRMRLRLKDRIAAFERRKPGGPSPA